MSLTSTDPTLYAATRLRSGGATRDHTIDSLMGAGWRLAEAADQVDAIDKQFGLDGRTLPEDVSPSVRKAVLEHREATKDAAPGPRFESPAATPASTDAPSAARPTYTDTPSRNVVPSLEELAAGSASAAGPRYVTPTPATTETGGTETTEPGTTVLTGKEKATLGTEAGRRARLGTSAERIAMWLEREGMSEQEASSVARRATQRANENRRQAQAAHKGDQSMAWLEIAGGVVVLIGGLAAGWFVGFGLFLIVDGFRRLA